ncbi:MAG: peptidylprolyl isomerase [Candidatus Gracilibacteria bacterium]|nr:peptidylprolyl isomerase [Candidatus Gracilibacteria bacterium]
MTFNQNEALQDGDIVAVMKTTNGTITIKLFTQQAPKTTLNFMGLAQKGYYNGIIFHRIIKSFMIQGGDPTGTGMGGESIYGEKFDDEFHSDLKNIPYSLSMANAGPNTNGSQFFINHVDNGFLNNKHAVFGQVVDGLDNVDKIIKVKTDGSDKPLKEVKMISVDIKEYKNATLKEYTFDLEAEKAKFTAEDKEKSEKKKTKKIEKNDTISVHYTGTLEDGSTFDSSHDRGQTLDFTVGAGQMIPGFDAGVVGMKIAEKKTLTLVPTDAYGEYDEKKIQVMQRKDLASFESAGIKLEAGADLPTQHGVFKIKEVKGDDIYIDVNHTLSGKTLTFDIEIIDIK